MPFSELDWLGENLEQDGATDAEQANSEIEDESEASLDREQMTVDAGTQTVNSDFKVKTQTHAATQTDKFEYLFKETVIHLLQKSNLLVIKEGCDFTLVCLVLMYLIPLFVLLDPFVSRKSKTLTLFQEFQEFVMVLIKLRLNVPLQDLAFRFGVSLPTVSRTFTTWLTVMVDY